MDEYAYGTFRMNNDYIYTFRPNDTKPHANSNDTLLDMINAFDFCMTAYTCMENIDFVSWYKIYIFQDCVDFGGSIDRDSPMKGNFLPSFVILSKCTVLGLINWIMNDL